MKKFKTSAYGSLVELSDTFHHGEVLKIQMRFKAKKQKCVPSLSSALTMFVDQLLVIQAKIVTQVNNVSNGLNLLDFVVQAHASPLQIVFLVSVVIQAFV